MVRMRMRARMRAWMGEGKEGCVYKALVPALILIFTLSLTPT